MSQLLENTYNAYEAFMEGELNEYELASLIEEGVISEDILDSIMEGIDFVHHYEGDKHPVVFLKSGHILDMNRNSIIHTNSLNIEEPSNSVNKFKHNLGTNYGKNNRKYRFSI